MLSRESQAFTYVLDETMRILVADDDPIQREFASVYLSTPYATSRDARTSIPLTAPIGSAPHHSW